MIISARLIRRPRKVWQCQAAVCMCKSLRIDGAHIMLYGSAERTDPKYNLRVHGECIGTALARESTTVGRALAAYLAFKRRDET